LLFVKLPTNIMVALKATDPTPPSGSVDADAAQQSGQLIESVTVDEKADTRPDDKDVKKPDGETKKKKPEANMSNYFVSDCGNRLLQTLIQSSASSPTAPSSMHF
jgi:hypothetical protein